jgi:hypothetical protein
MSQRHEHSEQNKHEASSIARSSFTPLEFERRTHVDTACAAYHLGRKPQTMRVWASTEQGPIRPVRINGRLSWPVAEIRRLLEPV